MLRSYRSRSGSGPCNGQRHCSSSRSHSPRRSPSTSLVNAQLAFRPNRLNRKQKGLFWWSWKRCLFLKPRRESKPSSTGRSVSICFPDLPFLSLWQLCHNFRISHQWKVVYNYHHWVSMQYSVYKHAVTPLVETIVGNDFFLGEFRGSICSPIKEEYRTWIRELDYRPLNPI